MDHSLCSVSVEEVPTSDSNQMFLIHLSNGQISISILNIGATIFGIFLPDKNGLPENVVLNYPSPHEYINDPYYLGCTVGRVAGRIAEGRLKVGNTLYQLDKNDGFKHHLHGGYDGLNKRFFEISRLVSDSEYASVELTYTSKHLDQGYPGNVEIKAEYKLGLENDLHIHYFANSDKLTHLNLTNHTYFNLSGKKKDGLNQELYINSQKVYDTDNLYIPTGELLNINETAPNYFYKTNNIYEQKNKMGGKLFNECYHLEKSTIADAILSYPELKRSIQFNTSYPALLFYSGDFLNTPFAKSEGICLEAQYPPDGPNQAYAHLTEISIEKAYHEYIKLKFIF